MEYQEIPSAIPSCHRQQFDTYPYSSSNAASASSSSSSVFSDAISVSSQSSISSSHSALSGSDSVWERDASRQGSNNALPSIQQVRDASRALDPPVSLEFRQNPRRTSCPRSSASGQSTCARPPPTLVRQVERKLNFVDNLVDSSAQIVETIWPLSVTPTCSMSGSGKGVLPLRSFIQETLRRSRTSYSTLQVALYYLIKLKPHVPNRDFTMEQNKASNASRMMQCGRRMFLAALILASKYLQDRNYSARAWSKISGLNTLEINSNEITFLKAVNWELHIPEALFQRWTEIVLKYTPNAHGNCNQYSSRQVYCWKDIVPRLNDKLEIMDVEASASSFAGRSPAGYSSYTELKMSFASETSALDINSRSLPPLSSVAPVQSCLPRLNLLPTPQLSMPSTPAVSVGTGRPSISSAMSQAQHAFMTRSTLDRRPSLARAASIEPQYHCAARRSSLARSTSSSSSNSSPESMISDTSSLSSRSSRSSSISSIASSTCVPSQPSLAQLATRRCANMMSTGSKGSRRTNVTSEPIDEVTIYSSPSSFDDVSSEVSGFSPGLLVDPIETAAKDAAHALISLPLANGAVESTMLPSNGSLQNARKRGRRSTLDEWNLQQNVRDLMMQRNDNIIIVEDDLQAESFLLQPKELQTPTMVGNGAVKLPVPLSLPRNSGSLKRACCSNEAAKQMKSSRARLPSGWGDILHSPLH